MLFKFYYDTNFEILEPRTNQFKVENAICQCCKINVNNENYNGTKWQLQNVNGCGIDSNY